MKKIILIHSVFVYFLLCACSVFALTPQDVDKYIETMKELKPYFDKYEQDFPDIDREEDLSSTSAKQAHLDPFSNNQEMDAIIKKHGYASPQEFADKGSQITRAMMLVFVNEAIADTSAYTARLEEDNLTPEMIENMVNAMAEGSQELKSMLSDVPESDINVVMPFMDQLEEVLN